MTRPASVAMLIVMSSCVPKRSREDRGARGSGSRCCSIAASPRGRAHGGVLRLERPRRPCWCRPAHRPARRWSSGRSSACWRAWRWRALRQRRREQQELIWEETHR
jgi:hypothetical protein